MMVTRTRIVAGLTGLVMAAGLTAGTAAPAAAAAGVTPSFDVVALGDSYGAGTGAGDYEPGTEGICYRSRNSASSILVERLRQRGTNVRFANVMCSGAAVQDLRQPFKGEPPQLDALRRSTDLVTLNIGGNDVDFAGYGGVCVQADCTGEPTEAILDRMPALKRSLSGLLTEIRRRSPRAQIVMTGYGRAVTRDQNAAGIPLDPICDAGVFSAEERLAGAKVSGALDATLSRTAQAARARGVDVRFVGPHLNSTTLRPEFAGHSLCESTDPFYRGFDALAPGQEGGVAVLHLNRQGHAALAALIQRKVPILAAP
ncbi:SGNH/GDSL hydrolase family protein [Streptosporangium sp. NPDC023825]|uniref:SGNH/GDSL hydrolase family protein n=1 Tax=Streptosporangium sp. NPDC023825 TaxID=3154909 RepID=UPI00341BC226